MPGAPRRPVAEGLADILRHASRMMAERGYHGASIRDLARETGRSLSGLYHYFRGKDDLLYLINRHGFDTLLTMLERALREPSAVDAAARLHAFVYVHTRFFVENMDAMRGMMWGTQELDAERAAEIRALKQRYAERARELVEAFDADGADAAHVDRRTFLLYGMMNWIYAWYDPRRHGGVDDLVADITETFAGGRLDATRIAELNATMRAWYDAQRPDAVTGWPRTGEVNE